MGRSGCCEKVGLKKGPWTPEEDQKLLDYIQQHGHGSWRALPSKAGLQRCGKSCRLRWINYLRPDIKRGKFTLQEEQTIIQLHALLGNRWSAIANHLPKRTDNEIKNYWNTHLKKRLAKMGIDPVTHKPRNDALLSTADGQSSKTSANLSHIAQWENARLEAEARLVRESRLRSSSMVKPELPAAMPSCSLDPLKAWNHGWSRSTRNSGILDHGIGGDLESPTSTLNFSENVLPIMATSEGAVPIVEFVGSSSSEEGFVNSSQLYKEGYENSMCFTSQEMTLSIETTRESAEEGFINLLNNNDERIVSDESENGSGRNSCEDNKNYWNTILNLANYSPSDSSIF